MPLVTEDMIRAIAPKARNISELVKHLNIYLEQYEINTPLRVWHFLAQAAHESMGFTTFSEADFLHIKDPQEKEQVIKRQCQRYETGTKKEYRAW